MLCAAHFSLIRSMLSVSNLISSEYRASIVGIGCVSARQWCAKGGAVDGAILTWQGLHIIVTTRLQ